MKYILFLLLFLAASSVLLAQVPQGINYQAIARDLDNSPIQNTQIGVRFSILQDSAGGASVYSETHQPTTNTLGLFNLAIGMGAPASGTFEAIDWGGSSYFLKVEVDPAGGTDYQLLGTAAPFLSVPYALRSSTDCNCTQIRDLTDGDTYVETEPAALGNDGDQIHMYLGESPGGGPPMPRKALVLRWNNSPIPNQNTMLEIFDPAPGGNNLFIGENSGLNNVTGTIPPTNPQGKNNTAVGYFTLANNTNGDHNTALGTDALRNNTSGRYNTAIGSQALYNNYAANPPSGPYGIENTAIGHAAMYGNSLVPAKNFGSYNTATGVNALGKNDKGNFNTAMGRWAMFSNLEGNNNTAVGAASLTSNQGNSRSTAIGYYAMHLADDRTIGRETFNTAVGYEALHGGNAVMLNNSGRWNTAVGDQALFINESGSNNTAIGTNALHKNVTGSFNTALGYGADVDGASAASLTNSTAIGANAKVSTSNSMILGDNAVNVGIGLSGNLNGPQNKLEIDAGTSLTPATASGLRLTRLDASSAVPLFSTNQLSTTTPTKVLSVDAATGNVVLIGLTDGSSGSSTDWNLSGNNITGINPIPFLGTTSNDPLRFKSNGTHSGIIDPGGQVFLGFEAGIVNNAQTNTGIGYQALKANTNGADNTAVGSQALLNNTGKSNTAIGSKAMLNNNTGVNNTAIGVEALTKNQAGIHNTATGVWAMRDNLGGNYNTSYGAFSMVLNQSGSANTAVGVDALGTNVVGNNNTAIGTSALQMNKADDNTATGVGALGKNTSGSQNTAVGTSALNANNTGSANTAHGAFALQSNVGDGNTAVGYNALNLNNTGITNTAVGIAAMNNNTIGDRNTATGAAALNFNDDGNDNSAFGKDALLVNKSGNWNTAVGKSALQQNFVGNANTAVGMTALSHNQNGSNNTAIGYGAGPGPSFTNLTNTTSVGYGAIVDVSNQIRLGNSAVTAVLPGFNCTSTANGVSLGNVNWKWREVWAFNGVFQSSDARLKSNIHNIKYGLDQVMALRPVNYQWKEIADNETMLGFIAQEIEKVIPESVIAPKNENEFYAMKYDALIPVLTKAIQEQQAQIEALKNQNQQTSGQNQSLQTQLDELRAEMQSFRAALEQQTAQIKKDGSK